MLSLHPLQPTLTPSTQVTRDTFPTLLPALRSALASADYVALDLEYTGIESGGDAPCPVDDAEDRYARIASAATRFAPLQVGLCVATWTETGYECATFNCPVWPGAVGGRQEMAVSAAALRFLTAAGFDTTAAIREGVPYAPLAWRDAALARAAADRARRAAPAEGGVGTPPARAPIIPTRPDDLAIVARVQQDVAAWLAAGEGEGGDTVPPPLTLPCGNAFQRALVYQTLRDGHGADPPFVAATGGGDPPPGVRRPRNAPIVVSRVAAGGAAAADAARAAESDAAIAAAAGFSVVMEALRDARVPIVVHNGSGDVLHLLSAFVGGGLPAEWSALKTLAARWFPGGLFDTKAMCGPPDTSPWGRGTSLREVYDGVVATGAVAVEGGSGRRSVAPPAPRVPPPSHAPGCDRYAAAAADPAAADATEHEAGFDAFLTAAAFWGLATREAVAAAAGGDAANGAPPPPSPPPRSPRDMVAALAAPPPPPRRIEWGVVAPWKNALYIHSSDLPFLAVGPRPDPRPARPRDHVVYVVPLPPALDCRGLASLVSVAARVRRCRVLPRLGGAAASVEVWDALDAAREAGAAGEAGSSPRRGGGAPPLSVGAAVSAAAATALAAAPELAGCRVLTASQYSEYCDGAEPSAAAAAASARAGLASEGDAPVGAKRRRTEDGGGGAQKRGCAIM